LPVETRLSNDLLSVTWNIKLSLNTVVVKVHTVIFVYFQLSGGVLASEGVTHVLDHTTLISSRLRKAESAHEAPLLMYVNFVSKVAVVDPRLANGGARSSAAQKFFWGGAVNDF